MITGLPDADIGRLLALFAVYVRAQACILVLPGLGERALPVRVRVAVAMALTPLLAQVVPLAPIGTAPFALIAIVAAEAVTGTVLGMFVRAMAMALDTAAAAIAQTASLSQILGVSDEMSPHPIGNLLHLAGIAVLMALGLPIMVCNLLADSLVLRPIGGWFDLSGLYPAVLALVVDSFSVAMTIAAPFVLGGFLFQLLSGVVARVMPALPVVFIAAPGAILLALVALTLLSPAVLAVWADAVLSMRVPIGP